MRFKSETRKPVQPELVASKDPSRPVLGVVHLNAEATEVWVCDSYMAARFPVELDEGDTTGPVPVEALKAARKPPLPHRGDDISIHLDGAAEVRQTVAGTTSTYLTVPRGFPSKYQFPRLGELFPDEDSYSGEGSFEVGLDVESLYKLAKAMGDTRVRLRFVKNNGAPSNMRPISVRPIGARENDASGILMPIRLSA